MEYITAEIINNKINTILLKIKNAKVSETYFDLNLLREALNDTDELRNFMVTNGITDRREEINEIAFKLSKNINSVYKKKI